MAHNFGAAPPGYGPAAHVPHAAAPMPPAAHMAPAMGNFGGGFPSAAGGGAGFPPGNNNGMINYNGVPVYPQGFTFQNPSATNYPTGTFGPESTPMPPVTYCACSAQSGTYKLPMPGCTYCQTCYWRQQGYGIFCANCDSYPVQTPGERCGSCVGWCQRCTRNACTQSSTFCLACQAALIPAPPTHTPVDNTPVQPPPVPVNPPPVPVNPPPVVTPVHDPTICKQCRARPPNPQFAYCQRCFLEMNSRACNADRNCLEEAFGGTTLCDIHTAGQRCRIANCARCATMGTLCRRHYKEGTSLQLLMPENTTHQSLTQQFSSQLPTPGTRIVGIVNIANVESNRRYQPTKDRVDAECAMYPAVGQRGNAQKRVLFVPNALRCNIMQTLQPCGNTTCGVCSLITHGFQGGNFAPGPYGTGLYFTWKLNQAHSGNPGTDNGSNVRCVVVSLVAAGHMEIVSQPCPTRTAPTPVPPGQPPHHSVLGREGTDRNADKLVVYSLESAVPAYLLFYQY